MLWASAGWARGWLRCSTTSVGLQKEKLSPVSRKGSFQVVCEELSPTKTCPSHLHHMSLVCRGHHNSSDPLRAELLLPVPCCPKAMKASVALPVDARGNRGRPQADCSSAFPGSALLSITGSDSWGQQHGKSFAQLSWTSWRRYTTGSLTHCSQTHWMKQISARLPRSGGFLKPGHAPK